MNHYIFLVDYSYSMNSHIPKIVNIINMFLSNVKQNNIITLASFSNNLRWILKAVNISVINKISTNDFKEPGLTALYDSVSTILMEFAGFHPNIKNYFYIITDGDDNCSTKFNRTNTDELCENAIKNGWNIKHFDTLNYQTLSIPKIKFDVDNMSELFNNMTM